MEGDVRRNNCMTEAMAIIKENVSYAFGSLSSENFKDLSLHVTDMLVSLLLLVAAVCVNGEFYAIIVQWK